MVSENLPILPSGCSFHWIRQDWGRSFYSCCMHCFLQWKGSRCSTIGWVRVLYKIDRQTDRRFIHLQFMKLHVMSGFLISGVHFVCIKHCGSHCSCFGMPLHGWLAAQRCGVADEASCVCFLARSQNGERRLLTVMSVRLRGTALLPHAEFS